MSFETALTGLNAASTDLDVTGNNISNSGTSGFKSSRAEFADIYAASNTGVSKTTVGQGVRVADIAQQFSQGQLDFTGNTLDLAVNGTGFFRMSDQGAIKYTRNGAFSLDKDGYIVNSNNQNLTGFLADSAGNITGQLGNLQIDTGDVAPQATGNLTVNANLAGGQQPPSVSTFDLTDPNSYNFTTSTTAYDSQGGQHQGNLYFVKTSTANQWQVYFGIDGDPNFTQGPQTLNFNTNGSFGSASGGVPTTYTISSASAGDTLAGVAPLNIAVDYSPLTQYGAQFGVNSLSQDGYAAGQYSSLSVDGTGHIAARYTNGQLKVLGQAALSRFPSPQNLQQIGDTSWVETYASGTPITDAAGSSGLGAIQSGALEQANVDVTAQLVKMITAQRNFQANAKMIGTEDQVTQDVINIR